MKKGILLFAILQFLRSSAIIGQTEPDAGQWNTWFITNVRDFRPAAPPSSKVEIKSILQAQKEMTKETAAQIRHWNIGAPGYHWSHLMDNTWMSDALKEGLLANMVLNVATYDATIAAWDAKYTFKRKRPFEANQSVVCHGAKPESPSYPCEYSVAAGVAVAVFTQFFPDMADSVNRMAKQCMEARIAAGLAYPSDTKAGFEMGKKIAEKEIAHTKGYLNYTPWSGPLPNKPGQWTGMFAYMPHAGKSKTIVLTSPSQFRPGPPPDYTEEMKELKNYKQTPGTMGNALKFNNEPVWSELMDKKVLEYNLDANPPRAARVYALSAIAMYETFVACWDAKYTYWGIRPEQLDPDFKPLAGQSPPFPGYPSGHAAMSGTFGVLLAYLFPDDAELFAKTAKDGGEARFQAGVHFRTDNDVALVLGGKVANLIIEKAKKDGSK